MTAEQFDAIQDKRAQAESRGDMVTYWALDALICYELGMPETALECLQRAQESVN